MRIYSGLFFLVCIFLFDIKVICVECVLEMNMFWLLVIVVLYSLYFFVYIVIIDWYLGVNGYRKDVLNDFVGFLCGCMKF